MINFNKKPSHLVSKISTTPAIRKQRPKTKLTRENKKFLEIIGLLR